MKGLCKAPTDWLGITGSDDRGLDDFSKGGATADDLVDEHSACGPVPAVTLFADCAELRAGALVITGETRAGTVPNLEGEATRVDEPTVGNAKLPA